jgi:hypothetical protein
MESSRRSVCRLALAGRHVTCVTWYFLSCEMLCTLYFTTSFSPIEFEGPLMRENFLFPVFFLRE